MVVLSETAPRRGLPAGAASRDAAATLQLLYGMPIDWRPVEANASLPACRRSSPRGCTRPTARRRCCGGCGCCSFSALALDDPDVIDRAASEALIEPGELRERGAPSPPVEAALEADMRAVPQSVARLPRAGLQAGWAAEERRYTCPSYELIRVTEPPVDWPTASRVDLPGYRPVEAYEAALANLGARARSAGPIPESVEEVLAWAGMPVATAEVAAVCDREVADVRDRPRARRHVPAGRRRRLLDRVPSD